MVVPETIAWALSLLKNRSPVMPALSNLLLFAVPMLNPPPAPKLHVPPETVPPLTVTLTVLLAVVATASVPPLSYRFSALFRL